MRRIDIEAWAYRTIDAMMATGTAEDAYVELKAEWPSNLARAARQLAGHANAARGEPVMWLIGVDEKQRKVVGAPEEELSNWWKQVAAEFEGPTPALQPVVVHPSQGPPVSALVFDTEARPFVVKNPDGGRIASEIPWREGNATRTVRRSELVQMLAPAAALPRVEVLWMQVTASLSGEVGLHWRLDAQLYFYSSPSQTLVIPSHRCTSVVSVPEYRMWVNLDMDAFHGSSDGLVSPTGSGLIVQGPGLANLIMYKQLPPTNLWSRSPSMAPEDDVDVSMDLFVEPVQSSVSIEQRLRNASAQSSSWGLWAYVFNTPVVRTTT